MLDAKIIARIQESVNDLLEVEAQILQDSIDGILILKPREYSYTEEQDLLAGRLGVLIEVDFVNKVRK